MRYQFAFCFLFFTSFVFAITCPTVSEIKQHQLQSWQAFDLENGTPLSLERLMAFEQGVNHFHEAMYVVDAPEGPAQCFYQGTHAQDVYLAEHHLHPDIRMNYWKKISNYRYRCEEDTSLCIFTS